MKGWISEARVGIATQRIKNFIDELRQQYVSDLTPLRASVFVTKDRLALEDTFELPRTPIALGDTWGENWASAYFVLEGVVPKEFAGKEAALKLNLGGEILIYDEQAKPLYGLTNCSQFDFDYMKNIHRLGCVSGPFTIYAEVAANELFGLDRVENKYTRDIPNVQGRWSGVFHEASIGLFNEDIWQLYCDLNALYSLYVKLEPHSTKAVRLLASMLDATLEYPVHGAVHSRAILSKEFAKPAVASALSTTVIGHAHIDTGWLWPIAETHRKVARTFASQIDNIGQYENYIFGASSPQHYLWTKKEHPAVYEKIKEAVRDKRWELLGGMWIEPDCSLVSGESLVRQILIGKKFFQREFGKDVRTCWIPDVFGYPASLPQILVKSGIPYFSTQKISWSLFNRFPYDSFLWKGIDGSEVITHFLPEHTYNSTGNLGSLVQAEHEFLEKDRLDEFISAVGIGDGGGGPKEETIERILRAKDMEGVPKARFGFVEDFFDRLAEHASLLETYRGELYLEFHRGTLTSQANNKKNNRRFEEGLRLVEALLSLDEQGDYPKALLVSLIQDGLAMQFHDILPGSCINEVYRETDIMYRNIFDGFMGLLKQYLTRRGVVSAGVSSVFGDIQPEGPVKYLAILNANQSGTYRMVRLPLPVLGDDEEYVLNGMIPVQEFAGTYYANLDIGICGWNHYEVSTRPKRQKERQDTNSGSLTLENAYMLYEFDTQGCLVKATDKATGQDYLYGRKGNGLRLYADEPHVYDAWDIEFYYPDQEIQELECVACHAAQSGPVFSSIHIEYRTAQSVISQDVLLPSDGRELYFRTHVDWKETKRLLRVDFPCDETVEEVRCDIPYGLLGRKTFVQNEWDFAKFEFCARDFVDVSTSLGGVALASDSKYGYSCRDGILGLSLLRSPLDPDPYADIHEHDFTYCFVPHTSELSESPIKRISSVLNGDFLAVSTATPVDFGMEAMPYALEGDGVTLSVTKPAEDGNGLVIRMVENYGKGTRVIVKTTKKGMRLVECDLLENLIGCEIVELPQEIRLKPFEIKTFREYIG